MSRVQGSGCRVQGAGCRVQGAGRMVQGSVFLGDVRVVLLRVLLLDVPSRLRARHGLLVGA